MRVHKRRSHYDRASTYAPSTAPERDDVSHLINNAFPPKNRLLATSIILDG